MKTNFMTILIVPLAAMRCLAQEPQIYTKEYWHAMHNGAEAKVTIEVTDETGRPVTNANTRVFFRMSSGSSEGNRATGVTDSEGKFMAEGRTTDSVFVAVEKNGYYATHHQYNAANRDPERLKDGRWLPWNPTIPVVLREIRNPIPMYVKKFDGVLPNGTTAGFDCEIGDFTPPHGSGKTTDFTITLTGSGVDMKKTKHSLHMASLDPAGGFRVAKLHQQSAFKSDYQAPEQGYSTNVFAELEYDSVHGINGSSVFQGNEYLAFKSRIKRDADGNIVSANHGKIYNEIEFMRGLGEYVGVGFLYYFNPTPNDRNLEFDGKNNLFRPGWNSELNWSREP